MPSSARSGNGRYNTFMLRCGSKPWRFIGPCYKSNKRYLIPKQALDSVLSGNPAASGRLPEFEPVIERWWELLMRLSARFHFYPVGSPTGVPKSSNSTG